VFTASCPACGARVSLKASASTTAVCGFCKSTLVRDAEALRRIGVQGELLEDYSRLQVGTGGRFEGRQFSVVGRIQLRYDAGAWNEWFVLFEDGSTGWLSEASGQYALTFDRGPQADAPAFDALSPGGKVPLQGAVYTVTDKRSAHCTAAEGELPFPADSRWEARVVDLRAGDRLATLDSSDGPVPVLYLGRAVTLDALQPTLLRPLALVQESAGALPGALQTLECPSCGAPVRFVTQLAPHVTCRQCKSELSAQPKGLVLELERADASQRASLLSVGDEGEHAGERWTVIGVLARRAEGDDTEWYEHLLYSPKAGFRWLVQADGALQWTDVLDEAPAAVGSRAKFGGAIFNRKDDYAATTTWVAGSFNWRPHVGDRAQVTEYEHRTGAGRTVLAMERTDTEVTWSRSVEVSPAAIARAFGKTPPAAARAANAGAGLRSGGGLRDLARLFLTMLVLFSLPALVTGRLGESIPTLLIAAFALWVPLKLVSGGDED
jgi:hypothetical protein